jgi:hypothetical protein
VILGQFDGVGESVSFAGRIAETHTPRLTVKPTEDGSRVGPDKVTSTVTPISPSNLQNGGSGTSASWIRLSHQRGRSATAPALSTTLSKRRDSDVSTVLDGSLVDEPNNNKQSLRSSQWRSGGSHPSSLRNKLSQDRITCLSESGFLWTVLRKKKEEQHWNAGT